MLENVIDIVKKSSVDNTLIVLGADMNKLILLVEKKSVKHCYNKNFKEGMLSSVKCGFGNLPSDYDAVMVFQGDQPLISAVTINMVIQAYRLTGKGIVIPVYDKKRGHPILIDRKYKDNIEKLDEKVGLRSLIYLFPDDIQEVETTDPGILMDFDTYAEYEKEINQIH
jgi:molybdenum cofactor cytidylyltransferase